MWYNKSKGFTLVELLVVISIIGLLSTIGTVSLNTARQKARDVRRIVDVRQIRLALELYRDSHQESYPVVSGGQGPLVLGSGPAKMLCESPSGFVGSLADCTGAMYMALLPQDPGTFAPYTYLSVNNNATLQCTQAPCMNYAIEFKLEGDVADMRAGTQCALAELTIAGSCPHP